jgi:selenocysteine lyase/cysteine desulfurase
LQGRKPEEQLIMAGMIPDIYKIRPNVRCHLNPARYQSLVASIEKLTKEGFLQQNDFSKKAEYLSELKDYFVQGLQSRGIGVNHVGDNYSPAIVSFTISGSRKLVRDIQRRGVFCSYISDTDDVRVSFDITNTKQEVDRYFELFDSLRKKG